MFIEKEEPRQISAVGSNDDEISTYQGFFYEHGSPGMDARSNLEIKLKEFKNANLTAAGKNRIEKLREDFELLVTSHLFDEFSIKLEQFCKLNQEEKRILAEKLYLKYKKQSTRFVLARTYWWKWILPISSIIAFILSIFAQNIHNLLCVIGLCLIFLHLLFLIYSEGRSFGGYELEFCLEYEELSEYDLIFPAEAEPQLLDGIQ